LAADHAWLGVVQEPRSARRPNPKEPIMAQLSDTQLIIRSNAAQHPDHIALPLPERLKGGATKIVVGSLLAKGFVEEVDAKRGEPIWRENGDGHGVTLVITDAGLSAIGIAPENAPQAPHSAPNTPRARGVAYTERRAIDSRRLAGAQDARRDQAGPDDLHAKPAGRRDHRRDR
jgi:hypothetical protein